MAKKNFFKLAAGVTVAAVAGKVAYDKYKDVKTKFDREEQESICDEVKKYNAVATSKTVEIEDEVFSGCEMKAVASKVTLDLSYAVIEKDVYINFDSKFSSVLIVLPDGVNATCDIEKVASSVHCDVDNSEENINTVYIIGKSNASSVEILPISAFTDEEVVEDDLDFVDEDFEEVEFNDDLDEPESASKFESVKATVVETAKKAKDAVTKAAGKAVAEVKNEPKDKSDIIKEIILEEEK